MTMRKSCTAVAPSSTANLGPGYDVFGLALDALYDRVRITPKPAEQKEGRITIKMSDSAIPSSTESNSAGLVIKKMAEDFEISDNLEVEVRKGVPAGYGMGSSAASAAAAAVAFAGLYKGKVNVDKRKLVEYAAEGEVASAGVRHYDNVSASVLGGFIISNMGSEGVPKFIRIEPPKDLFVVVAVPTIPVPARKTEVARSVLPKEVSLRRVVQNVSGASTVVAGFALGDVEMIALGIDDDTIVEPARKHLIPGYDVVRKNALSAGALAVTISGAGPSMIAFLKGNKRRRHVAKAMEVGFGEAGVMCRTFACAPSKGARIL
jgi:homoserine kinase